MIYKFHSIDYQKPFYFFKFSTKFTTNYNLYQKYIYDRLEEKVFFESHLSIIHHIPNTKNQRYKLMGIKFAQIL